MTLGVSLVLHLVIIFACILRQGLLPAYWTGSSLHQTGWPVSLGHPPVPSSPEWKLQMQQVLHQLRHLCSSWWPSLVREISYGSEGWPGLMEPSGTEWTWVSMPGLPPLLFAKPLLQMWPPLLVTAWFIPFCPSFHVV